MPEPREHDHREEEHETNNRNSNLGPWILGSSALFAIPLLLCCFPRGCNRGCNGCHEPIPAPKKDTVFVKEYHVGGDMINIEGNNNNANLTKGDNNNVSAGSTIIKYEDAKKVQPKPKKVIKKTVVQPEPESTPEPKPDPTPEPKPEVVEKNCTVVITYQVPCNCR